MNDSIRHIALAAAVASLGAAIPGAALAQPGNMSQPGNQNQPVNNNQSVNNGANNGSVNGRMQRNMRQSARIPLLPAADIVGRPVVDLRGQDAGRVDSMVLDTKNGVIEYLIIGSRGNFNLNGQLIAVPWSAVQTPRGKGAVGLTISLQKLENAPRVSRNALYRLGTSAWRNRVYGYYGYPYPYYGSPTWYGPYRPGYPYTASTPGMGGVYGENGTVQANAQNAGPNRAYYNNEGGNNGANNGYGRRRVNYNNGNGNYAQNNNGANNSYSGQGYTSGSGNDANQSGGNSSTLSVSRNGVVSSLMAQSNTSPNQLRAANVIARNGQEMGHVNEVMIDTRSGHIAYVLLKRGGFLGLNPTWYPVPVQALTWANGRYGYNNGVGYGGYGNGGYGYGYQLVVNERLMRGIPSVPVNQANLTTYAPRRDLARLYRHFHVQPYWNGNGRNNSANQQSTYGQGEQ
ncbi:MAG TPA: PRC-barrel domain-containing protein [Pseudolabrys sp.]|nr:PRC-barrel domain-containing protein [Pseudolabrys sp.]